MFPDAREQLDRIRDGVSEIIPEAELLDKLERSIASAKSEDRSPEARSGAPDSGGARPGSGPARTAPVSPDRWSR